MRNLSNGDPCACDVYLRFRHGWVRAWLPPPGVPTGQDPITGRSPPCPSLQPLGPAALTTVPTAPAAMTSEQAAQLIDNTLDLVHQRLQDLEAQALNLEHRALAAEFREWRHPSGGHIDLMVFPGLTNT